jgi:hypothetical protein
LVGHALGTVFGMNSTLNQQLLPGATDNDDTHNKQHGTRALLNPDADATTAGTFDLYFMVLMSILFFSVSRCQIALRYPSMPLEY